jgi:hypothetical protein
LTVLPGFTVRDTSEGLTDRSLKYIAFWFQWEVKHFDIMRKIRPELTLGFSQKMCLDTLSTTPLEARDAFLLLDQDNPTERCFQCFFKHLAARMGNRSTIEDYLNPRAQNGVVAKPYTSSATDCFKLGVAQFFWFVVAVIFVHYYPRTLL